MAYELLSDVETIVLGGIDKNTGKKNPTQVEGYFIRVEERPNKFNKNKPQNYYVLKTEKGDLGLYGKAGIDKEMKKARLGAMTKIVHTGRTLDTGMGNPMIVFEVYQDKSNSIEIEAPTSNVSSLTTTASYDSSGSDESGSDLDEPYTDESFEEEEPVVVAAPAPRAAAPRQVATAPSASQQARVQALLNKNRQKAI